jgi:hypothetical protein
LALVSTHSKGWLWLVRRMWSWCNECDDETRTDSAEQIKQSLLRRQERERERSKRTGSCWWLTTDKRLAAKDADSCYCTAKTTARHSICRARSTRQGRGRRRSADEMHAFTAVVHWLCSFKPLPAPSQHSSRPTEALSRPFWLEATDDNEDGDGEEEDEGHLDIWALDSGDWQSIRLVSLHFLSQHTGSAFNFSAFFASTLLFSFFAAFRCSSTLIRTQPEVHSWLPLTTVRQSSWTTRVVLSSNLMRFLANLKELKGNGDDDDARLIVALFVCALEFELF